MDLSLRRKFLINPKSGPGISDDRIRDWKIFFNSKGVDFNFWISTSNSDLEDYTRKLVASREVDQVVAIGGDGTVHTVINGFFEDRSPLALNPQVRLAIGNAGSGSDFFRGLASRALKPDLDWKELVLTSKPHRTDLGWARFSSHQFKPVIFMNAAGVGINTEVVEGKAKLPVQTPSVAKYLLPTVKSLWSYSCPEVKVESLEFTLESKILLLYAFKGIYCGGGMKLGAGALPSDGLFQVSCVEPLSVFQAMKQIPGLYTGTFVEQQGIQRWKTSKLKITSNSTLKVELDGELYGTTDLELEVLPRAVLIDMF